MKTRRLSIVCLVLVVGLAGCSGISPFSGNQSETATDTHDISYPGGYDESGITDPETAIDQHESVLEESDSLTLNLNVTSEVSIFNMSVGFQLEQNATNEREYFSGNVKAENSTFMRQGEYKSDGMIYEMNETEGEPTRYEAYRESFSGPSSFDEGFISTWLTNATLDAATRDTHNGEQVFRYNVTDADAAEPFVIGLAEDPTLNDLNGTLTVDENGIVRSVTYTINYTAADGTDKTLSADYQMADLNSTTVEEPDWVETAREQA